MSMRRRSRVGIIAGVVIVLGLFTYLLAGGIGNNLVYFLTPGELLARGDKAYGQPVRLGGLVAANSVQWDAEKLDLRFIMEDEKGERIEVHARSAPPQMFREGIGVVVEGRLTPSGVFESTNLMVKHSNEYKAPEKGHDPEKMFRTLVREPAK